MGWHLRLAVKDEGQDKLGLHTEICLNKKRVVVFTMEVKLHLMSKWEILSMTLYVHFKALQSRHSKEKRENKRLLQ